jgi:hypothetical protein
MRKLMDEGRVKRRKKSEEHGSGIEVREPK